MYLNETMMLDNAKSARKKLIIGVVVSGFLIFGIVAGLLGSEDLAESRTTYIVMLLPFLYLIYAGLRKQKLAGLCNRLNQAFIADADGIVPLNTILSVIGTQDENKAEKIINNLISEGYLQNVTFDPAKPHTLVLFGKSPEAIKTESITCPYCGASVERRTGYSVTCPYCKSVIG